MSEKNKILIVEDEAIIAMDMQLMLEKLGYNVCCQLSHAEKVLDKVKETQPNLILMDIRLKGKMTGIEAAIELNKFYDTPIIYISSEITHERLNKTKIPNTYGFLVKPIREDALYTTIEIALDKYNLHKNLEKTNEELERTNEEFERTNEELELSIEELEESKEEILKSEIKFKNLFNSSSEIVVVFDMNVNVIEANDTAIYKLGYDRETLFNLNLRDFQSEEENSKIENRKNLMTKEKTHYFESELISKDGQKIPIEANITIIEYEGKDAILAIGRDLTDRLKAEKEIKITNQRMEMSLDVGNIAWWEWNIKKDKFIFHHNKIGMLGYNEGEINPNFNEFINMIHPKDKNYIIKMRDDYLNGLSDKYEIEYRIKTKDDLWLWVYDKSKVTDRNSNGKPDKILGVTYDINERKRKEDKLKRISKILKETSMMAKVGGWEADLENHEQQWTDETYKIHEVESNFVPTIENGVAFFHPEDKHIIENVVSKAIETGEMYDVELRLITAKSNLKWVRCIGKGSKDNNHINKIYGTIQDITERKLYQIELEKQAYYIENAYDGIITTDMNFNVTSWNRAAEKIYGWRKDEVIGKIYPGFNERKFKGKTKDQALGEYYDKGYWEGEFLNKRKDGTWINVYSSVVMLKDENGNPLENLAIHRDITHKKQLEGKIKYQAKLLRNINDAVISISNDLSIISWNKGAENIYGWSEDEVIGRNIRKLLPTEYVNNNFQNIINEINSKGSWKGEVYQYNKNGKKLNISSSVTLIKDEGGNESYYVTVNRDISRIKEVEYEIKLKNDAIEHSINAFDIVNSDRKFIYVNKAYLKMWGYDSEEELIGNSPKNHCLDETLPQKIIDNLKEYGNYETEFIAKRKDGSTFDVRMSTFLFRDIHGNEYYAGSSIDITERKRAEKELKDRQALLNSVFDVIPDGINIIDNDFNIIESNHTIKKWFREQMPLKGKKCYNVFYGLNEICNDCPKKDFKMNSYMDIREKHKSVYNKTKKIWTKIYSYPLKNDKGEITGTLEYIRDITDEKNLLTELSQSEARLKEAENTAHIGYYEFDMEKRVPVWSEETFKIFGFNPDTDNEPNLDEYMNYLHEEDRDRVYKQIKESVMNLDDFIIEHKILTKNKKTKYVYCIGKVRKDKETGTIKIFGTIQDITEQKVLSQKLTQSEIKYKTLFESANDAILVMDKDTVVDCNSKALDIYLCNSKDEIIGKRPMDFSPDVQPDGTTSMEKSLEKINASLKEGGQVFEWKAKRKNGELFDTEVSLNNFFIDGKIHVLSIVRDISGRRRLEQDIIDSQKQLSSIIDSIRGIFYRCLINENWTMEYISKGCYRLTGYKDEDFYNNNITFNDIIYEDDRQFVRAEIYKAIKKGKHFELEYRIVTSDKEIKWVWEKGKKINYAGKSYLEGYIADITDNKLYKQRIERINLELEEKVEERTSELEASNEELEGTNEELSMLNEEYEATNEELRNTNYEMEKTLDELRETQSQLVESEKMSALGELVSGVAHEINTPLGIAVTSSSHICSNLQKYHKLYTNDDMTHEDLVRFFEFTQELAQMIKTNLNRVANLVNSFKQISVDQSVKDKRKFKVKKYIEHILISMHSKIKKTNHKINVNADDDIEINSYPDAFFQIITNLVNNSLIHGFENIKEGKVDITLNKTKTELILIYKDNGIGIKKYNLSKVFDPFYTTKRNQGGTGLGLNIIYNIVVQKLRGKITCDSSPGKGVSFHIVIPLEQ